MAARFLIVALLSVALGMAAHAAEPPLPAGLAPAAPPAKEEPDLPAGLAPTAPASPAEPELPAGLGPAAPTPSEEPALPVGLDTAPGVAPPPENDREGLRLRDRLPPLHGFWEARGGVRTQRDPAARVAATMAETRVQLKSEYAWKQLVAEATADVYLDGVVFDESGIDVRQARLTWTATRHLDFRIGRQILTWGTGDLLFINDLFPKDWNSFFIGRDVEYLKAPSNAIKAGAYFNLLNFEAVYTPLFDPDRIITGDRISFWNPMFKRYDGRRRELDYAAPNGWFKDHEIALRAYRSFGKYEAAIYGYTGFWKSPGGQRIIPFMQARFPRLNVYGASLRGPIGKGMANVELGYYDSRQDRAGDNMIINNSEFRFLAGYERELMKDFTGGVQYYVEVMMHHDKYKRNLLFWVKPKDQARHVITARLTRLMLNQNLILSMFTYFSPSDLDAYLRPNVQYKINDHWTVEGGANIFLGTSKTTFFGQFQRNTNIYAGARYSF